MNPHINHQILPSSGPAREALRVKGQFWTPAWTAEAMVAYVLNGGSDHIFDPAVGEGAFFRAAKTLARELNRPISLLGTELDRDALQQARQNQLGDSDLDGVQNTDFIQSPPQQQYQAIVANPPYIRHHRLSAETKSALKRLSYDIIGQAIDGRAGLHIYFLLRALQLLTPNGRLAFIMPADTGEGKFASVLWNWIVRNYRLDAVITFSPEASPFPGVDTNPIIFFIRSASPEENFKWVRCLVPGTYDLKNWVLSDFNNVSDALLVHERAITEGLSTGLTRQPVSLQHEGFTLGDFAKAMRGIATGANEFFYLTRKQAADYNLPAKFLLPAVGRTRDVIGDEITSETLKSLDGSGRPTLLFSPTGEPAENFPEAMRNYLKEGEALGLHKRTLIATRRPWYKMEVRPAPALLFAYLGRRNARFIRNYAGVLPLTGFLCIYPNVNDPSYADKLWKILRHPSTIENLTLVGKSYGAGAIKVEPRGLEKLPLLKEVVYESEIPIKMKLQF